MSHNRRMETQRNNLTITQKEAEEYCAYKRQKKISEIMSAMRRSGSVLTAEEGVARLVERATRLRQASVRMRPTDVLQRGELFLKSSLKVDCIVGGNGETFSKVKAYEAKKALRAGAKELTLILTPSLIAGCRYHELRKEMRRVRKTARNVVLKAKVEKVYPKPTLSRLARLAAETGYDYFSVPYFAGCQHLQTELSGGCFLEVSGVETLPQFKEMAGAGMGRVLTSHAWDIYTEWLKEVEEIFVERQTGSKEKAEEEGEEKPIAPDKPSLLPAIPAKIGGINAIPNA